MFKSLSRKGIFNVIGLVVALTITGGLSSVARAQKHSPVWDSYLSRVSVGKVARDRVELEFQYIKNGGPGRQTHAQFELYLIRAEDEEKILEIASRQELLDKSKTDEPMFLDVLQEQGLVVRVGREVGKRNQPLDPEDTVGGKQRFKPFKDLEEAVSKNVFAFNFRLDTATLISEAAKLSDFKIPEPESEDYIWRRTYPDRVKLMAFVPVNDSKYATHVPESCKGYVDFPWDPQHPFGGNPSPIQFLKVLNYEFTLIELRDQGFRILIH